LSKEQNILVGKTIKEVFLASDSKAMKFVTDEGDIIAKADGDCCSDSWVESVDDPTVLIDATVLEVEDTSMPDLGSPGEYDGVIAYYGCKITTTKGRAVIDYRNSSNGYYGGNLSWPDDKYFYGGVHGQNISNEDWKPLSD
jgi:hypothetical protein